MINHDDNRDPCPTIRKLYPHLSNEQLIEAQENLDAYLRAVLQLYERISADPKEYARFTKLLEEKKKTIRSLCGQS